MHFTATLGAARVVNCAEVSKMGQRVLIHFHQQ